MSLVYPKQNQLNQNSANFFHILRPEILSFCDTELLSLSACEEDHLYEV
jgi:hypothetical protein